MHNKTQDLNISQVLTFFTYTYTNYIFLARICKYFATSSSEWVTIIPTGRSFQLSMALMSKIDVQLSIYEHLIYILCFDQYRYVVSTVTRVDQNFMHVYC